MEPLGQIRGRAEDCQSLFARCLSHPLFAELDWFENRQGEFNLWAASLKATSTGRPSLDYRLKDRPDVREVICDLLEGLSEALAGLLQPVASPAEIEIDTGDDTAENPDSIFSSLSSNGDDDDDDDDTVSLPSMGKADGPFSEQMFSVKTILGELARISTAIRRSGANYRYQKADAALKEERFQEFKKHLTIVVLMGCIESRTEEPAGDFDITAQVTDSSRLTPVQERLIHANVVRRNRIIFATRSMKPVYLRAPQQPSLGIVKVLDAAAEPVAELPQKPSQVVFEHPVVSSQAHSIVTASAADTATGIGSQFNWEKATESKKPSPSVMTKVTRTGTAQDYPSCPKPISDNTIQCPYCADILSASYAKNMSRWKGHVAQDVLPHICIYDGCETPDRMYLTSDELLKHMLGHHSITRWVCDYCVSQSGADQSFIFTRVDDWEFHMKTEHAAASTLPQLLSLSKVSQRKMLEPLACPLCGYVAEHASSSLDDHIAKHLHGFALRCLPWGTGGDETDSINAKSIDTSRISEDADEVDDSNLPSTESDSPAKIFHFLDRLVNPAAYDAHILDRLKAVKILISYQINFLDVQAISRRREMLTARQLSNPCPIVDISQSTCSHQVRLAGNLLNYPPGTFSNPVAATDSLSDAAVSHLFKITHMLYQTTIAWGMKSSKSAFEFFCNESGALLRSNEVEERRNIQTELVQRWSNLSAIQRDEFNSKLNREMDDIRRFVTDNTRETQLILEGELVALELVLSDLERLQNASLSPIRPNDQSHGSKIDIQDVKRFELTEVYSHPDAKADIVFVHGLNGHPRRTWESKNGVFWPSHLLPVSLKSAQARILVYGYNADVYTFGSPVDLPLATNRIHHHAQSMLMNLLTDRRGEGAENRPLLFVAHSLGGILLKRVLLLSYESMAGPGDQYLASICNSTWGIIFLGTPHAVDDEAQWGSTCRNMVDALIPTAANPSPPQFTKVLQAGCKTMQNINFRFLEILPRFRVCMVHEAQQTRLMLKKTFIVDKTMAGPMLPGANYFKIEATHINLSKFDSKDSPGYLNVSSTLRLWVQEALFIVQPRWDQDRIWETSPYKQPSILPPSLVADQEKSNQKTPYFITPREFRPNSLCIGRETELKDLHRMLFDKERRVVGTSAVLIQSMPGCGKTHLATEYVYRHKNDFPGGIFWLSAESRLEIRAGFHAIAHKVREMAATDIPGDPKSTALVSSESVRAWFNQRQEWLLILDGIYFNDAMRESIPDCPNTSLIYTSTARVSGDNYHHSIQPQIIKLAPLSAREAQKLLLVEIGKLKPFDKDDMEHSMELVQAMGFLPLTIHSAARRLNLAREPLSKFVSSYKLKTELHGLKAYSAVVIRLKSLGAYEALNLIHLICFYSQNIPVEMISLGLRAIDVPVRASDPIVGHSLNESFKVLNSFGLIARNEFEQPDEIEPNESTNTRDMLGDAIDVISVHCVVQDFFVDTLYEDGSLPEWLDRASRAFCCSYDLATSKIDQKSNVGSTDDYRIYETHGKKLRWHFTRYKTGRLSNKFTKEQKNNLTVAHDSLEQRLSMIADEIERRTVGSSGILVRAGGLIDNFQKSVFDRDGSSSSGPASPTAGQLPTDPITWDLDQHQGRLSPERMTQDYEQRLTPAAGYQSSRLFSDVEADDAGYDSFNDELNVSNTQLRQKMDTQLEAKRKLALTRLQSLDEWEPYRHQVPSRSRAPEITISLESPRDRKVNQSKPVSYADSSGAFRAMMSADPSAMKGKAIDLDAGSSTETGRSFLQSNASPSRDRKYEAWDSSTSGAQAALGHIAKSRGPPPLRHGAVSGETPTSSRTTSPRPLMFGRPSAAPATAAVTRETVTSYKAPEPSERK